MNKANLLILMISVANAGTTITFSDYLYVRAGETYRKPLTEFFSTNEKYQYRFNGQQPNEISLINNDFDQTQFASQYSQSIKEVISAKPYIIDQYYHHQNLFGFLSESEDQEYVFSFNSVNSSEPQFDRSIDLSQETQDMTCFDFDFYNHQDLIVVCIKEEELIKNFYFLRVHLQTNAIEIIKFVPKQTYHEITRLKLIIDSHKSQQNNKVLYLGVSGFNDNSKSYQTHSMIEQYRISDHKLQFDQVIDDELISQNYNRRAGLVLVDFTIIGDKILIVDKDPQGDDAYIYTVGPQVLTNKIDPLKIQVKSSTPAYLDTSYVYLHKQEEFTLSKQYYLSVVFSDDSQTLTDSHDLLPSYTQLKYDDKENNIIARITQNYKIILNKDTQTLYAQNLYQKTYEKTLKIEGQPLGLITNQQTDCLIILFDSYSIQYSIQEPYILIKPKDPRPLQKYTVQMGDIYSSTVFYQALAHDDHKLYLKNPSLLSKIFIKEINNKASTTVPITVFGPAVELEYEQDPELTLSVLKQKSSFITVNGQEVSGQNLHVAKRFQQNVAVLLKVSDFKQDLLSCDIDIENAKCHTINIKFQDKIAEYYQFSQSSDRYDFGIQSENDIDIYLNKKYSYTLTRILPIKHFIMTGELLIVQDQQCLVFYLYQEQDLAIPILIIDRHLLQNLGYFKQFSPQKFFMNYDISTILIIQNNNDLIVGRYDSTFQIIKILQITQDANLFISISEQGFYVLEQKEAYQSLKSYSLVQSKIELMGDNPLSDYKLLNDQAFDPITQIIAISAQKDNRYCILVIDPKLLPRDAMYRIIFFEDNVQMKNLQITSQDSKLSITGFVNQQLKQYSTLRSGFFVEGQLVPTINFSSSKFLEIYYSNPQWKLGSKQFVDLLTDQNKIRENKYYDLKEYVNPQRQTKIQLPSDLFIGNIANFEFKCDQCLTDNINFQTPIMKTSQNHMIGTQKQCLNLITGDFLLCINANSIQLFEHFKVIDQYMIDGKGVSIYSTYNAIFIATLTDSSLVFVIKDGRINIQSTSQSMIGYSQQIINLENQFILVLHQDGDNNNDGYEIFKFQVVEGMQVLKSLKIKLMPNIRSLAYSAVYKSIMYVCNDRNLYFQKTKIQNSQINFDEQFKIDVRYVVEKQNIHLVTPQFVWINDDVNYPSIYFLFDSDGNGYKVSIHEKEVKTVEFQVMNIYPTAREGGIKINSINANSQFVVVNKEFSDSNYIMIYQYNNKANNEPNKNLKYMLGAQNIKSQISLLTQQAGYSTLGIQVEEGILAFYNLTESISVIVNDGCIYQNQTISISSSNFYQSQEVSIYLEKPLIGDSNSSTKPRSSLLWVYITFPALLIGGIVGIIIYKKQQNENVGLLQQSQHE